MYICMQFILNRLAAVPCKHIFCHFTFSLQYKKQELFICSCFAVIMPSLGAPL